MKDEPYMITVCEWPDGSWCEIEDLIYNLQWKSDDFMYITLSPEDYEEKYL